MNVHQSLINSITLFSFSSITQPVIDLSGIIYGRNVTSSSLVELCYINPDLSLFDKKKSVLNMFTFDFHYFQKLLFWVDLFYTLGLSLDLQRTCSSQIRVLCNSYNGIGRSDYIYQNFDIKKKQKINNRFQYFFSFYAHGNANVCSIQLSEQLTNLIWGVSLLSCNCKTNPYHMNYISRIQITYA